MLARFGTEGQTAWRLAGGLDERPPALAPPPDGPHRQRGARPAGRDGRAGGVPGPGPGRGAARPALGARLGLHPRGDRRRDRARRAARAGVARRGQPHRRCHRRPAPLAARRLAPRLGPPPPDGRHQPPLAHARRGRAGRWSSARLLGQRCRHGRPGQPGRRPRAGPARRRLGVGARVAGEPRPRHPGGAHPRRGRRPHRRAPRRRPGTASRVPGPARCPARHPPGSTTTPSPPSSSTPTTSR